MIKVSVLVDNEPMMVTTNSMKMVGEIAQKAHYHQFCLKPDTGQAYVPPNVIQIVGIE